MGGEDAGRGVEQGEQGEGHRVLPHGEVRGARAAREGSQDFPVDVTHTWPLKKPSAKMCVTRSCSYSSGLGFSDLGNVDLTTG